MAGVGFKKVLFSVLFRFFFKGDLSFAGGRYREGATLRREARFSACSHGFKEYEIMSRQLQEPVSSECLTPEEERFVQDCVWQSLPLQAIAERCVQQFRRRRPYKNYLLLISRPAGGLVAVTT